MRFEFEQQTVVVTGAAQGIGREIALSFARAGAHVHAVDIDADGLESPELADLHRHTCDLSSQAQTDTLLASVLEHNGRVEVLVNAAGGVCGQVGKPIETVNESDWRTIHGANVDSAFWLARAAAPSMKASGYGRIVFISSGAGLRPSLTGIQAYAAAKHAVVGLTRQLALELGSFGITVNSVAPGFLLSNPSSARQWESLGQDGQHRLVDSIHTRRLGKPEDISSATLFLCSKESGWITGQILSVDGGRAG